MSIKETVKKGAKDVTISAMVNLLDKDPDKNVDKLYSLANKMAKGKEEKEQIQGVYSYYNNNPATHEYIQNILKTMIKKMILHRL